MLTLFSFKIHINFSAKEYQEPEELKDTILPFSQIGPPRNVTVELEDESYLVSWEAPDYGYDILSLYVIRWYLEPDHKLVNQGETRNNFYKSKTNKRSFTKFTMSF